MAAPLAPRILSVDPRIRSVLITDRSGNFLEFKTQSSRSRIRMSDTDIRTLGSASSAMIVENVAFMEKYFGAVSCVTTRMERADMHTIALGDRIAVLTTRPNDLPPEIAKKIKELKP